jgi:hypothetical protein
LHPKPPDHPQHQQEADGEDGTDQKQTVQAVLMFPDSERNIEEMEGSIAASAIMTAPQLGTQAREQLIQ